MAVSGFVDPIAESVLHRPPALLRPYVESYVGYRYAGFPPGEHMGLPSRHLTFVVSFDAPVELAVMPDGTEGPWTYDALLGGLHTSPAVIRHDGSQHGIQLGVTPAGARGLFGLPAGELARAVLPLDAIWGRLAGELLDRLSAARTWPERFAAFDGVLLRALSARVELPSGARRETTAAWDRLTSSAGRVAVATLAAELGWSRRHLTEQFANEYGVTPRSLAKVLRFERARRLLVRPDRSTLAAVAASCGYSDQAHMVHDWHDLAGSSPSAWLDSEVLPFVQDEDAPERSQWSHD